MRPLLAAAGALGMGAADGQIELQRFLAGAQAYWRHPYRRKEKR